MAPWTTSITKTAQHTYRTFGGSAPESPSTLYLPEHRVQLCHQSLTLDQLDYTDKAGQIPVSQMPHRVSTMGSSRCQQPQQEVLPGSPMTCHQGHSSHTSGQRWLGTAADQPHHFNRYILFVPDEVSNRQRPRVAQQMQTRSRPSGMGPQPID